MPIANRRSALLALASTAVAVPALLQTRSVFAQSMNGNDYKAKTLETGTVALDTSKVAADKAQNPMVKEFAGLEISEQQTIAAILTSTGFSAPQLPADKQAMVEQMRSMPAGPDFDKAYVNAQIQGHQDLLNTQKAISGMNELSVEVITAKMAEQAITSHLAMLNHIKEQLGA